MEFLIKSQSKEELYTVTVVQEKAGPSFSCTCPAGMMGKHCKHRLALIAGDERDVVQSTHDVADVPKLVSGTVLEEVITQLSVDEDAVKRAQAALSATKKRLGRIMQGNQKLPRSQKPLPSADPKATIEKSLTGKVIVFSGSFEHLTRAQAKKVAEDNGAKVSGNVSQKTDFFVCGEGAGSKAEKAQAMGIAAISETEFLAMLE